GSHVRDRQPPHQVPLRLLLLGGAQRATDRHRNPLQVGGTDPDPGELLQILRALYKRLLARKARDPASDLESRGAPIQSQRAIQGRKAVATGGTMVIGTGPEVLAVDRNEAPGRFVA